MVLAARSLATRGLADWPTDTSELAPAITGFDLGSGTSSWVWSSVGADPALYLGLTGTSTWTWTTQNATLLATAQLTGTSDWVWGSSGYLDVPVPVVPPPAGSNAEDNLTMIEHVYRVYDPFVLTDSLPDEDTPFDEFRSDWGRYMVEINGADVTFLRGQTVKIVDIAWEEPYDDARVTFLFPQVSCLENYGTGDTAMLRDHCEIRVWRVLPNGSKDTEPEFEGWLAFWGHQGNRLTAECKGVLHQIDLFIRAPGATDIPDDIGRLLASQWNKDSRPSYIGAPMSAVVTGIDSRDRGAWDDGVMNFTDRQLKRAVLANGSQYTIKKRYPMQGYITLKDTTTVHFTLPVGIHGVNTDGLQRDLTTGVNVWYAEGEDEAGTRWRNSYPTADGLGIFFQPLSYDPAVHPYDEEANGQLSLHMDRYDPSIFRIEAKADFGQGWNKVEAKRVLDSQRARMASDGTDWFGEIVLTTDPPEMSRRKIRPGMNFTIPFHDVIVKFHVSAVRISDPMGKATTSLTVDTRARDVDEIQNAIERQANAVKNPVRQLLIGRESTLTKDKVQPWDSTRGDGFVPRARYFDGVSTFSCPMKKYSVQRFTIGEEETIAKIRIVSNPPAVIHASVCNQPPKGMDPKAEHYEGVLADWPSDPFIDGAWLPPALPQPPLGQKQGYGKFGQAGGYYPGTQTNPVSGLTGVIQDENEWEWTHADVDKNQRQPTYGWLVVWAHDKATNVYATIERVKRVG